MKFSDRLELSKKAVKWCHNNHIPVLSFNIITALSAMGYLRESVLKSNRRETIDKVRTEAYYNQDTGEWTSFSPPIFYMENDSKKKVSNIEVTRCGDCGLPYSEMGLDLVLPDQQWNKLFPEKYGILCANCICKRAKRLGGTVVLSWVDKLDYSQKDENKGNSYE